MAIDKFVIGRTYKWSDSHKENDRFVVTGVDDYEDKLYYCYPNWQSEGDFVHNVSLSEVNFEVVVLSTEEKENRMADIKVGQKYTYVGKTWGALAGTTATVSDVSGERVSIESGGWDPRELFFPDLDAYEDSGENLGYVLVEEEEKEEDNQLSPNVYQFPNGVQVKDISAHLTSFGGQAVQYIARATRLDGVVKGLPVQDLYKAIELLKWEAERMEALEK